MIGTETSEPETGAVESSRQDVEDTSAPRPEKTTGRIDGLIVWAAVSLAFLAFIAFGSVDARIWRFNNLQIESRSVLRIWTLQAESLPRVAQQWMLTSLFYACIFVIIVCTLMGIWFLLDSAGTGSSKASADTSADATGEPA